MFPVVLLHFHEYHCPMSPNRGDNTTTRPIVLFVCINHIGVKPPILILAKFLSHLLVELSHSVELAKGKFVCEGDVWQGDVHLAPSPLTLDRHAFGWQHVCEHTCTAARLCPQGNGLHQAANCH